MGNIVCVLAYKGVSTVNRVSRTVLYFYHSDQFFFVIVAPSRYFIVEACRQVRQNRSHYSRSRAIRPSCQIIRDESPVCQAVVEMSQSVIMHKRSPATPRPNEYDHAQGLFAGGYTACPAEEPVDSRRQTKRSADIAPEEVKRLSPECFHPRLPAYIEFGDLISHYSS